MARIFKTPFGAQGDTEQVPEAPQGDGSVSLTQGFGYDYEREYDDPAAKDIRREVMNGLFHDVTEAIGDIQLSGIAKWSEDAAPYPAGAVVWYNNEAWKSRVGNNSAAPAEGANWKAVDLSSSIRLSESIDQVPDAETVQQALAGLGAFAGGSYQNIAVFDTSGVINWTVPDVLRQGLRKAHVTVIGGGGGAGRVDGHGGAGGGGGGVAELLVDLTGINSVPITVGAGGQGREGSSGAGGDGGSSSFGTYASATGGFGAIGNGAVPNDGGIGNGGQLNYSLGPSSGPTSTTGGTTVSGGSGGGPGRRGTADPVKLPPPSSPGGGGGGSSGDGGNGARGVVIVRW